MAMKDEITAQSRGARFFRADLHIHSNAGSHDVKDATCTPAAIVAAAKKEGLDIIAIADHNEITGVEPAAVAAKAAGIMLVPAVELSTQQGHLLCYLPTIEALKKFHGRLTIADSGTATSRCQQSMLECLKQLDELGGFGVFAHVDGGNGFETNNPGAAPHKKDILFHQSLLGLELLSVASVVRYSDQDPDANRRSLGRERTEKLALGAQQYLARIVNSDSHTLEAVGRNAAKDSKVTRFKMNSLTFESLRLAMSESDARVRIEEEIPKNIPQVVGIRMSGGFLDGQVVHFSSNLNCIIGGRGTGKSTMFEGIRHLSGQPGDPAPVVNSDVWPLQVDLLVQDQVGQQHPITRAKEGERENPDELFATPVTFPIECYRQGETHEISQRAQHDPLALLTYLDRFVEIEDDIKQEVVLRDRLLDLQAEIEKAKENIDAIPKCTADLKYIQGQIAAIEKAKGRDVIELQRIVATERNIRSVILTKANAINTGVSRKEIKEGIVAIKAAADPSTLKVGTVEFAAITTLAGIFDTALAASDAGLRTSATTLSDGIKAQLAVWQAKAQVTNQQVEEKRQELENQGIKVDMAYFAKLAADEARLTTNLSNLRIWQPHLLSVEAERKKCLDERWAVRERIAGKRSAFAKIASETLKTALTDITVTLKFDRSAYSTHANDIIVRTMAWRTVQVPRASALTEMLTIPALLEAIDKKNTAPITALIDDEGKRHFSKAEADSLIERLGDAPVRYQLERCEIVDRPRLTVTRMIAVPGGKFLPLIRDFSHLSLGQQQSVLLALMLSSDSNLPLIIDQPEDNLDSEFIYHSIVPVLRRAKERRQIIVVTHNANIAVLGDAEQVIVLKSTAEKASIIARGSIDDIQTRDAACNILEGSREAFKRRARIYGFKIAQL